MLTLKHLLRISFALLLTLGLSFGVMSSVTAESADSGVSMQVEVPPLPEDPDDEEVGAFVQGLLAQLLAILGELFSGGDVLPELPTDVLPELPILDDLRGGGLDGLLSPSGQ